MSDAVPVADAMEEAQAVLDAEHVTLDGGTTTECLAGDYQPTTAMPEAAPVQVPLFEPPPFDFEQAYDELHRLDQRARLRKSAWEIAKSDASDAKKSYDTAIEDLHKKFAEIERARSEAQKPHASNATTGGGDPQMSDMEATLGDEPQEPQDETPKEEPSEEKRDYDAGIGY